MGADLHELMKCTCAADDRPVINGNMTSYLHGVHEDTIIADETIMRHVHISHEQTVLADGCFKLVRGPATDRDELADHSIVADVRLRFLSRELEVLGN